MIEMTTRMMALSLVILAGLAAVAVSGYFLLVDWASLNQEFARFERVSTAAPANLAALFVANARQEVFRINCFADGVGVLLGAILAAIGIHGWCLLPAPANPPDAAAPAGAVRGSESANGSGLSLPNQPQ